ncbi:MAG: rRNA maturation RNase YbeY [Candidatus Levybacteria bacterium]|nr:rRNA maturation RNase YbeY [Candidatus Levybacteria bacterium]
MANINSSDKSEVNVLLFVESRYKVNRKRITASIRQVLKEQQVVGAVEVSVAIIGDRKMSQLNKKYLQKEGTTNVLSFSLSEGDPTVLPPAASTSDIDVLRLGDIVISYPQIIGEAAEEDMMVDDKIDELVKHGLMHLLGIHHEE